MDTTSTPNTSNPNKPNRSVLKTIFFSILCAATFSSLLFLHRYSPRALWLAANAIIFSVYKLSSSSHANHSDPQPDPQPILASLPSNTWHDYPSPSAEQELIEKEVTHVDTVGEKDQEVVKGAVNMDDTWKEITMPGSSAAVRKPQLKKSDTWERSQPPLQRADEVGMKPELKKSATYKEGREKSIAQEMEEKGSKGDTGWRTREVLVVAHDELFKRVENFIKKQHDHLRLQRQESEYRRFLERFRK